MKKNIKELTSALNKIEKEDVVISIFHKLYGDQKIECNFYPITDSRIGFMIKEQDIYINRDEISYIHLKDNCICFADDLMKIKIEVK